MDTQSLCFTSIAHLAELISRHELSPVDVVEAHLQRIEALNPGLLAFLEVTAETARRQAKAAETEIIAGRSRGPLHGIPYGAKDIFDTAGVRTTQGSSLFRDRVPADDAESVARLNRAGAVLLGKCHTHEFAAGGTTVNPHYGTTRNPWNLARIAGGSSGGSAAALAAGLCPAALGSDTGGSIRTPAAFCSVVGLKPTHGRVSLRGVCPNTPSFDHVGPMTRTVGDAALVLQIIAGYDPRDPMSRDVPVPDFSAKLRKGIRGVRLALCPDFTGHAAVDREVAGAFDRTVATLGALGASIETVPFPHYERIERTMNAILGAEFAEVHRPSYTMNPEAYGKDVRARLERAFTVTLDDYVRALRERELLRRDMDELFQRVDAIVLPSTPCVAAPIDTLMARINGQELECLWLHRPFLTPHNLTGCPAIAVPMGFSTDGLPLSLQIVGRQWGEADILRIAHAYEAATPDIQARRPPGIG
jgi:aspartyl-tRNA(Asn)/glutamyl-tRNA(Gln) amidotransferase subunit A